jgi:hypothetical protein
MPFVTKNEKLIINDNFSSRVQIFKNVQKSCHKVTFLNIFLPRRFSPCKYTFMDDYDGI